MSEIKIYNNNGKIKQAIFIFLGIIFFLSVFIYNEVSFVRFNYKVINLFINVLGLLMEGVITTFLCIFFIGLINKLITKIPVWTINSDYLSCNGILIKYRIQWSDFEFYKHNILGDKNAIILKIRDESEVLQELNLVQIFLFEFNKLAYQGEVLLILGACDNKYDALLEFVNSKVMSKE